MQDVFRRILNDQRYKANLDWGKPRGGHPEGTVRAHIEELERNLDALIPEISEEQYWKLRILIHVHDTFKAEARTGVAISDPRSHASLARGFLAEYCQDPDFLNMVQYHDEGYALWLGSTGRAVNAQRFQNLLDTIHDWELFLLFNIIDGCTAGKDRDHVRWFLDEVNGRLHTAVTSALLL